MLMVPDSTVHHLKEESKQKSYTYRYLLIKQHNHEQCLKIPYRCGKNFKLLCGVVSYYRKNLHIFICVVNGTITRAVSLVSYFD